MNRYLIFFRGWDFVFCNFCKKKNKNQIYNYEKSLLHPTSSTGPTPARGGSGDARGKGSGTFWKIGWSPVSSPVGTCPIAQFAQLFTNLFMKTQIIRRVSKKLCKLGNCAPTNPTHCGELCGTVSSQTTHLHCEGSICEACGRGFVRCGRRCEWTAFWAPFFTEGALWALWNFLENWVVASIVPYWDLPNCPICTTFYKPLHENSNYKEGL